MWIKGYKKHKDTEKSERDKHVPGNYKTMKETFFKFVRWYDVIHSWIKYERFCRHIKKRFTKKENMNQYRIISICQITIHIINCPQEDASLIAKQGEVKKKMCICFNIKATWAKWIQSILKTMSEFKLT